jgi:hypothetical protein
MTPTRPSAASIGLGRPNDLAHFSVSWAMIFAEQIHRDRALWEAVAEGSNIRID